MYATRLSHLLLCSSNRSPKAVSKAKLLPNNRRVSRSGSVPNLATDSSSHASMQLSSVSTIQKPHRRQRNHRTASTYGHHNISSDYGNSLQADVLQYQRHLLAMVDAECQAIGDYVDSQGRYNEKTKRSDTAKRHVLSRQKPIQKEEQSRTSNSLR